MFELSTDDVTINASKINGTGPSNCLDLQGIEYFLEGFYVVRFNEERIKTVYCNFNQTNENIKTDGTTSPLTNRNVPKYQEFSNFCKYFRSQPCIALYSDFPDTPLFEFQRNDISTHVSTKKETRRPTNCEDLHSMGYSLKGFYWVTWTAKKVKLVYCEFNEIKEKDKTNVATKIIESQNTTSTEKRKSSGALPHCNDIGSQPCSCYHLQSSCSLS